MVYTCGSLFKCLAKALVVKSINLLCSRLCYMDCFESLEESASYKSVIHQLSLRSVSCMVSPINMKLSALHQQHIG